MESYKIIHAEPVLSLNKVSVSYDDTPVLRDVSITLHKGEIIGIVGESGSGKSTSIYAAMGILGKGGKITEGTISFKNEELLELSPEKIRRLRGRELALIAQNPASAFHPTRKINAQLKELVKTHKKMTWSEARERMLELMRHMRLDDGERILDSYAFELSGGMCQRVAIAMAMVLTPEVLFADEPTSALDVTVQAQVVEELLEIRRRYGTSILMVSHNMGVIAHMSDFIVVMYAGMILEQGTPAEVLKFPHHAYTKNLIQAIPRLNRPAPHGIQPCKPDRMKSGCPYSKGCPKCSPMCEEQMPPLQQLSENHWVRCHFI